MMAAHSADVFFYEAFEEEVEALRRHLPPHMRAAFSWKTVQEQGDAEPPVPLISVRTQSIIPAAWMTQLTAVLSRTTGYDNVQQFRNSVPCGYLPTYCSRAVAEQAMLLWMALLRKLPMQMKQFSRFHRDGLTGSECEGKNLLCVGVGNIGHEVVQLGRGLGMQVQGVDIEKRHPFLTYVSIDEGLPWADVIVCAMSLNANNVGYFGYEKLSRTRRGAIFVNVGRGELSPPLDLLRLVDMGHIGGAALDVFEKESELAVALRSQQQIDDEQVRVTLTLAQRPNVILTPHNAFNTREAVERKAAQSVQQIDHFLAHKKFLWPVP